MQFLNKLHLAPTSTRPLKQFPVSSSTSSSRRLHVLGASHYETLGISNKASDDEIKRAFRLAAKRFHPDVNKEIGAEAKFMQINDAYKTLSDPKQKAQYDQIMKYGQGAMRNEGMSSQSGNGWVEYTWVVNVEDEVDDEDDKDVMDFFTWASTANNYKSSFQSSWGANSKRRRRQAAEAAAREESEKKAKEAAAARAAAEAADAASASARGRRGSSTRKTPNMKTIDGFDPDDILESMGPEIRTTAQSVFGSRLEGLESVRELADFVDMFDVLGANMGVQFQLLNEDDDDEDVEQHDGDESDYDDIIDALFMPKQRIGGRNGGGRSARSSSGTSAWGKKSENPSSTSSTRTASCSSTAATGRGSSSGRRSNWQSSTSWESFVSDFDSGASTSSSSEKGRQKSSSEARQKSPSSCRKKGSASANMDMPDMPMGDMLLDEVLELLNDSIDNPPPRRRKPRGG